ncbi:hypothetical protein R5R35_011018 [Gryllus longicercus]|uniref:Uncharacterized protein n=1 Tax=Gryllus longicercus TaxID=2509291 RepID=A0AAN9VKV4_9ORTH
MQQHALRPSLGLRRLSTPPALPTSRRRPSLQRAYVARAVAVPSRGSAYVPPRPALLFFPLRATLACSAPTSSASLLAELLSRHTFSVLTSHVPTVTRFSATSTPTRLSQRFFSLTLFYL